MALKMHYGTYTTGNGTLVVNQSKPAIEHSPKGEPLTKTIRYGVQGILREADAATLATAAAALRTAFATDGQDFAIEWPSTSVAAGLEITSANTLSGVRVVEPPELNGSKGGATLLTLFPYSLVVEAVSDMQAGNALVDYNETYTKTNPRAKGATAVHFPISDKVQIYNTSEKGAVYVTQSGSATGWTDYPEIPSPRWESHEMKDQRSIVYNEPARKYPNGDRMFKVDWSYTFVSASRLKGTPNEEPTV